MNRAARARRLTRASGRVVRPHSPEAAELEAADDAYWDQLPIDERMALAFWLSIHQWRVHGWRENRRGRRLSRSVARVRRP